MKRSILLFVLAALILAFMAEYAISQNIELMGSWNPSVFIDMIDIKVTGHYAYISTTNTGLIIMDFSHATTPVQVAHITTYPFDSSNNLFISGNYGFICNGSSNIAFIDITDPVNPVLVDSFSGPSTYYNIWVMGQYAYLASSQPGITVVNIANLHNPVFVANQPVSNGIVKLVGAGNYLYADESTLLETYDISNPTNILLSDSDSILFSQDIDISNNCLFNLSSHVDFYSLDNPANPEYIRSVSTGGQHMRISGNYLYFYDTYYGTGYNMSLYALDISESTHPLLMGQLVDTHINSPLAICARNDTVFIAANSRFNIYRISNRIKGTLAGVVKNVNNNQPVEGAIVTHIFSDFIDTTDAQGSFLFNGLYEVNHSIKTSHPLFHERVDNGLMIIPGDTTYYTILLGHGSIIDAGIGGMVSPPQIIRADTVYSVIPRIVNCCQDTLSFDFYIQGFMAGSSVPLFSHTERIESLSPLSTITPLIDSLSILPNTVYKIESYIVSPVDQNPGNDTLRFYCSSDTTPLKIWYGKPDGSPIIATIGDQVNIDVYAKTRPDVYIADLHLCLGANDTYIDTLLSQSFGIIDSIFYRLNWMDHAFLAPQGSPPNPAGWSSQSFLGFQNDWGRPLRSTIPIKILTFAMKTINDTSLIGDTVNCFGPGINTYNGHSWAGDTVGGPGYPVTEHFPLLVFRPRCDYVIGDLNGDGNPIGGDVTYAVRYFKSQGLPPVDSCYMDSTDTWFYPAGDVNGNCEFRGSDITRMVAYFKSTATLAYCHFFPPTR